jgi:hypothetical protein
MASADFSRPFAREISPGKVHEHSARAARLSRMPLSVTLGFRVLSHAHRPHPASLPVRLPAVLPSLQTSFLHQASRLLPSLALRLFSLFPVISFHLTCSCPCRAHECDTSRRFWIRLTDQKEAKAARSAALQKRPVRLGHLESFSIFALREVPWPWGRLASTKRFLSCTKQVAIPTPSRSPSSWLEPGARLSGRIHPSQNRWSREL